MRPTSWLKMVFLGIEPPPYIPDEPVIVEQPGIGITCPECGAKDIRGDECPSCSASLLNYYDICPKCSSMITTEQTVCSFCGYVLKAPVEQESSADVLRVAHDSIVTENIARILSFNLVDILKTSWWVFRKRGNVFLAAALLFFPVKIIDYYWSVMPVKHLPFLLKISSDLAAVLFNGLAYALFSVLIAVVTLKIINNEEAFPVTLFKLSLSKLGAAFWANMLATIMIMGLFVCLIIPGIIWSVYYFFVVYVIALRDERGKAALNYSKALVRGNWWKVSGYFVAFWAIGSLPLAVFSILTIFVKESVGSRIAYLGFESLFNCFFDITMMMMFLNLEYVYHNKQTEAVGNAHPA